MPEPLDPRAMEGLVEIAGGDREFVCTLIDDYLADASAMVVGLRDATGEQLIRSAHTLKSTSATFGAGRLAAICSELERAARDGDRPADLVAAAESEYAGVRSALVAERERFA
jgi:HPt (histidine-containing phosphotransfer) domain-containing protein